VAGDPRALEGCDPTRGGGRVPSVSGAHRRDLLDFLGSFLDRATDAHDAAVPHARGARNGRAKNVRLRPCAPSGAGRPDQGPRGDAAIRRGALEWPTASQ
jgi:hypothetical protein